MLQDKLMLSSRQAHHLVNTFFEQISCALEQQKKVKLYGFGNFEINHKAARPGRNPKTGESVVIKPRRVVVFKPGQKLKKELAQTTDNEVK